MLLARQSGAPKDEPGEYFPSYGADTEFEQVDPTAQVLSYSRLPAGDHELDTGYDLPADLHRHDPGFDPDIDPESGYWDWDNYDQPVDYQDADDYHYPVDHRYPAEGYDDHESSMTWMAREGFEMVRPVALRFEESALRLMSRWSTRLAEVSLGVVYIWFGVLKFFPELSPAEGLVKETAAAVTDVVGVPLPLTPTLILLAGWEVAVGTLFMVGRYRRVVIWMVLAHLLATALPFLLLPDVVWTKAPFGLTLIGQYIVKNLVLVAAALAVGAATRVRAQAQAPTQPY